MKLIPLSDRVILRRLADAELRTASGIILMDDSPHTARYEVMAVGAGVDLSKCPVSVGDIVHANKEDGIDIQGQRVMSSFMLYAIHKEE